MAKWRVGEPDMQWKPIKTDVWIDCEIIEVGHFRTVRGACVPYKIKPAYEHRPINPRANFWSSSEENLRKKPRQQDTQPAESEWIEQQGWLKQREEA